MTGDRAAGRLLLAGLAIMFVIGAGGCRRDGRVTCTGSVTYAGAPVERGVVGFVDDATRFSRLNFSSGGFSGTLFVTCT